MGDVIPPSANQPGSGDIFSMPNDEEKRKTEIMSYEQYKKWLKKWQKKHQKE
jgi:hypothetical protein